MPEQEKADGAGARLWQAIAMQTINHSVNAAATRETWRHIARSKRRSCSRPNESTLDRLRSRRTIEPSCTNCVSGPAWTDSIWMFRFFAHASMAAVVRATPFASWYESENSAILGIVICASQVRPKAGTTYVFNGVQRGPDHRKHNRTGN